VAEALTERPRPGRHLLLVVATCVVAVAATAGGAIAIVGPSSTTSSSRVAADRACPATAPSAPTPLLDGGALTAEPIARAEAPTALALHPGRAGAGVLGERGGRILQVEDGAVTDHVVLDLSGDTMNEGDGGLLGVQYDPDGTWLYVYRATGAQDDRLTAYPVDEAGTPDPQAERVILHVDHPPSRQHHGGSLLFGADGLLYIGLGDGGGLGDPRENAQNPGTLLGKVLRIDPTPTGPRPYTVPRDNPFVGRAGWRSEIWALGVRNPFRMSVDEATGDLWIGDVGQTCWEELDRLASAGANLGWDRREGMSDFEGGDLRGHELGPVHAYPHADGWCAIVAGYVPQRSAIPSLDGWLLHTDYCRGRLVALRVSDDTGTVEIRDLGLRVESPIAIVPGPSGRPWILTLDGDVLEIRD
jgi:glucose/arabinose dehydrogenase